MAGEFDAVIVDFSQRAQGEHLVSAAVGQYGPVPGHKFMESAKLFNRLDPGPEQQMVGIAQDDAGACFLEAAAE